MSRTRDLAPYSNLKHFKYGSFEDLLGGVQETGVHSTNSTALQFDVLVESRAERGNETPVLVTFHAAVASDSTFPYFSGRGVAASAGMDLLAFSDPSLAVSTRFGSNFFLGTSTFDPTDHIIRVIRQVIGQRKLVFLGSSAGGFPALKFGNMFPDSVTLAMNPVTDLMVNDTFLRRGAKLAFPRWGYEKIAADREIAVNGVNNLVVYAQNVQDRKFIRTHASRYFASLTRVDDEILLLLRDWGKGHVPMPAPEVADVLKAVRTHETLAGLEEAVNGRVVRGDNASAVVADARLAAYRQRQRLRRSD